MTIWQDASTAPRDGTIILGLYDNDLSWEPRIVYWVLDKSYPWMSYEADTAWAEDRISYWTPIPEPPYHHDGDNAK